LFCHCGHIFAPFPTPTFFAPTHTPPHTRCLYWLCPAAHARTTPRTLRLPLPHLPQPPPPVTCLTPAILLQHAPLPRTLHTARFPTPHCPCLATARVWFTGLRRCRWTHRFAAGRALRCRCLFTCITAGCRSTDAARRRTLPVRRLVTPLVSPFRGRGLKLGSTYHHRRYHPLHTCCHSLCHTCMLCTPYLRPPSLPPARVQPRLPFTTITTTLRTL